MHDGELEVEEDGVLPKEAKGLVVLPSKHKKTWYVTSHVLIRLSRRCESLAATVRQPYHRQTRTKRPREERPKLKAKYLDDANLVRSLSVKCCSERHNDILLDNAALVRVRREHIHRDMNTTNQRTFLLRHFQTSGTTDFKFVDRNHVEHDICATAFRQVYGLGKTRFYQVKSEFDGRLTLSEYTHGREGRCGEGEKEIDVCAYIDNYLRELGEHMPDVDQVHLPSHVKKDNMYLGGWLCQFSTCQLCVTIPLQNQWPAHGVP